MATEGIKLVLTFKTNEDKTAQYSFNYAKEEATAAQVKNLMTTMINNTSTYENTLVSAERAQIVITEVVEFDLTTDSLTEGTLSDSEAIERGIIDFDGNFVSPAVRAMKKAAASTTIIG